MLHLLEKGPWGSIFTHSKWNDRETMFRCDLICISVVTAGIEWSTFPTPSSCWCVSLDQWPLFIGLVPPFAVLDMILLGFIRILWVLPSLSHTCNLQRLFSHSVGHLFMLQTVSFAVYKRFSLIECYLSTEAFGQDLLCHPSWPRTHEDPLRLCLPSTGSNYPSSLSVIFPENNTSP